MLKVTISGYYLSNGSKVDYNNVDVQMPECDEGYILSEVINRMIPQKFSDAKQSYSAPGKCYIDKVTKTKSKPSFNGKNIKELGWVEIEDLAIAYNLRSVPLFRSSSLVDARIKAYQEFCNKVKGMDLKDGFDYKNAENFVVGDATSTTDTTEGDLPLE